MDNHYRMGIRIMLHESQLHFGSNSFPVNLGAHQGQLCIERTAVFQKLKGIHDQQSPGRVQPERGVNCIQAAHGREDLHIICALGSFQKHLHGTFRYHGVPGDPIKDIALGGLFQEDADNVLIDFLKTAPSVIKAVKAFKGNPPAQKFLHQGMLFCTQID